MRITIRPGDIPKARGTKNRKNAKTAKGGTDTATNESNPSEGE